MRRKLRILFSIDEHAQPDSLSYQGEHVKKSGNETLILYRTISFVIKSKINTLLLKPLGQCLSRGLCFVAVLVFSGMQLTAQEITLQVVTKTIQKQLAYKAGNEVVIEGEKAEVEVVTWAKNEVSVDMQLIAKHPERATAEAELENMQYEIERNGNRIIIRNFIDKKDGKPVSNLRAHYVVSVPENCPVVLSNYFGKTNVKNLANGLNINSEFCSIGLSNIQGDIGIKTRFGDIEGEKMSGNVNIEASRSNITLSQLGGKFNIKAQYGTIKVFADQSNMDLTINADKSDVYFYDTRLSAYNYALTAHNGKIDVPHRMSFDFIENTSEIKHAVYKPSSEMAGVRVAINVSFGEIKIGE